MTTLLYYAPTSADKELKDAMKIYDITGVENVLTNQSHNMNINYIDVTDNTTPLLFAVMIKSNHRIVSALLHRDADPNITHFPTGWNALHTVCRYGELHTIELLLKFGANVNCQDNNGQTPLHLLILSYTMNITTDLEDIVRCIQLLLDNHANVNVQDIYGRTCLFCAIERTISKKLNILQYLLLNSNVDVNFQLQRHYRYIKGDTILHCAVREMNIEIVNMILECCTPHLLLRNSNKETAYDIAHKLHHKPIMESLKMTLLLECHAYLRQQWIHNKK